MENMTEKENTVVEELRRRTTSEMTPKMLEDVSLFYRFAKARDFKLVEAESMLRKYISWRKEIKLDTILTDYKPPEVLVKYAPTSFICFDKKGAFVRILDVGRADPKGLRTVVTTTDFIKFCAFVMEQDLERVVERGENSRVQMYSIILDCDNLKYANAMNVKNIKFVLLLLKCLIDNSPEILRIVTIINVPSYFEWVYAAIKPILPSAVIKKVRIYGKDGWKEVFLDEIDSGDLPAYLGGKRTDPDGNPLCETFIQRGQIIPKRYYLVNGRKKSILETNIEKATVLPFSKEEICFEVKEKDSYIVWEFETVNRDIDFSVVFRRKFPEDSEPDILIHKPRINTSGKPEKGSLKCDKLGSYTIVFDNSYSWIHSKDIYYRAEIKDPNNEDI